MRTALLMALLTLIAILDAFCQVDTLGFHEIGTITLPAYFGEMYVEDLNADGHKELIVKSTESSLIFVYDPTGTNLLWTSPQLSSHIQIKFADFDGDGSKDMGVRDDDGLYLFDPIDSSTIWTCPNFDSTFVLYGFGLRNEDSLTDLAVVREIYRGPSSDYDSVLVDLYDGPSFAYSGGFYILMRNYRWNNGYSYGEDSETPSSVAMGITTSHTGPRRVIALGTTVIEDYHGPSGIGGGTMDGKLRFFEPGNFDSINTIVSGNITDLNFIDIASERRICSISKTYSYNFGWSTDQYYLRSISVDTTVSSVLIHNRTSPDYVAWRGYIMGDLIEDAEGLELCYGMGDTVKMLSLDNFAVRWLAAQPATNSILGLYHSSGLTQVVTGFAVSYSERGYRLFDVDDGAYSAYVNPGNAGIYAISDINGDSNDEILGNHGYYASIIGVYTLVPAVGISEDGFTPNLASLSSAYPNPFNAQTSIRYSLQAAGQVMLTVYDLLGRKAATLYEGTGRAGEQTVTWDASGFPSGIYFARLESGERAETIKMVLLK